MHSPRTLLVAPPADRAETRLTDSPEILSAARANASAFTIQSAFHRSVRGPSPKLAPGREPPVGLSPRALPELSAPPSTVLRAQLSLPARLELRGLSPTATRATLPPDGFCQSKQPTSTPTYSRTPAGSATNRVSCLVTPLVAERSPPNLSPLGVTSPLDAVTPRRDVRTSPRIFPSLLLPGHPTSPSRAPLSRNRYSGTAAAVATPNKLGRFGLAHPARRRDSR